MRADVLSRVLRATGLAAAFAVLASCAAPGPGARAAPAAEIWDVAAGRFIDEPTLVARIAPARYRLLGEVHDNPDHHRLRARVLSDLVATGRRPAVVFEQLDFGHEAALEAAEARGADADAVAAAGGLDARGWRWPLHKPLIEAALAVRLPVRPGNVSRQALDGVVRGGKAAGLDGAWLVRLANAPWTAEQVQELGEDILESHCGKLPASIVPRLAFAQRVRDAAMADALVRDATPDGAVLIAGNGHVRGALGVPVYLSAEKGGTVTVGWIEVGAKERDAADFPRALLSDLRDFDYVWFTGRVEREDPCRDMPEVGPVRASASG
jgi:uncharacterized iron-regulated protein